VSSRRTTNPAAGGQRYAGFGSPGAREAMSFSAIGGNILQDAIDAVTGAGDLVSFSRTRDGGAVVVSIVSDGAVLKAYAADLEELRDALVTATEAAIANP
jgi:hypothetical protein